jgi:hypothetical protein
MDSLYDLEGSLEEERGPALKKLRELLERLIEKKIGYYL